MSRVRLLVSLVVFVVVLYGLTLTFATRFPELRPKALDEFSDITPIEAPVDPETAGAAAPPVVPPTPVVGCDLVFLCLNVLGEWIIWGGTALASVFINIAKTIGDAIEQGLRGARLLVSVVTLEIPLFDTPLLALVRIAILAIVTVVVGFLIVESLRSFIPFLPGGV